jgi:UDP-N-acetylmuramoyl-tripeptide--D-alanyl-D-alanine ligase
MPEFHPDHLAQITQGTWHFGPAPAIGGFCFDTRRIVRGDCFIALTSGQRDGHDFVADAMAGGASAALTARPIDCGLPQLVVEDPLLAMGAIGADVRSGFQKPVIGVTGSCGKTSTKEMLRLLLGGDNTHATAGNFNNRIGVPMTLFKLDRERHEYAVIEAGINQPGEMALLGGMIEADLSILTNIGPAHLELLGSLEGIAEEKSKLAERSRKGAPLVLPLDVLQYPAYAAMKARCIAVQFGDEPTVDGVGEFVRCRIEASPAGDASTVMIDGQEYRVASSSEGIAKNAALAIVTARRLGLPPQVLAERIRQWQPERTRGRVVTRAGRFYYIDCYNANPASMVDALQAFQKSAPAELPRCYVLGAMNELGPSAGSFHHSVGGRLQPRPSDLAVFVGPEEMTAAYRCGAESGGAEPEQIKCAENVAAIESMVADFEGALFLKGSRAYHLEDLLPESL